MTDAVSAQPTSANLDPEPLRGEPKSCRDVRKAKETVEIEFVHSRRMAPLPPRVYERNRSLSAHPVGRALWAMSPEGVIGGRYPLSGR